MTLIRQMLTDFFISARIRCIRVIRVLFFQMHGRKLYNHRVSVLSVSPWSNLRYPLHQRTRHLCPVGCLEEGCYLLVIG